MDWLNLLRAGSINVDNFVRKNGDENPDNYQVKWDVVRMIISRRPAGTLRHLPSKTSISF